MKKTNFLSLFLFLGIATLASSSTAQIIPDQTLPNNSSVIQNQNLSIIQGGTESGSNLFHSFRDFSVINGQSVYFNNTPHIQNILSRVTGNTVSILDGLIKANGTSNFFFINPNGIIIGKNIALDFGGSVILSTASSVNFSDGFDYFTAPKPTNLLSVNTPVGLNFNSNPGNLIIVNQGHNFRIKDFIFFPGFEGIGLQVRPGKTLGLLGGNIFSQGGIIRSNGGQVFLGSFASGEVRFDVNNFSFSLNNNVLFKDIQLTGRSVVDSSGFDRGNIQIIGKNIEIVNGSIIFNQNLSSSQLGKVALEASESIRINGTEPMILVPGGIRTQGISVKKLDGTTLEGLANNIVISAPNLTLEQGGVIQSISLSNFDAGNITLNISDTLQIIGSYPVPPFASSNIASVTFTSAKAGDIVINTSNLIAKDGGSIVTGTVGLGNSGNVNIQAAESITISGFEPNTLLQSNISSATANAGNAGNITVKAPKLIIENGGIISSSTIASGLAGNIVLDIKDFIEVTGTGSFSNPNSINSRILSSASLANESVRRIFRFPGLDELTGDGGQIIINTGSLKISDGAAVTVGSEGTGNAGNLQINAASVVLDKGAGITASTASGEGGNITITSQDIRLFDNSQITATAGGTGDGGNITIDTDTLALLENSSITANAFEGQGGNINITAEGLLVSPDSAITASSQFGSEGVVQLNIDPFQIISADTGLPVNESSLEALLTQTCSILSKRRDRFTVRGTGGTAVDQVRSYTLEDLAPSGQVFGFIKRSNGTVRLLSCDSLEGLNSEMSSNQD